MRNWGEKPKDLFIIAEKSLKSGQENRGRKSRISNFKSRVK